MKIIMKLCLCLILLVGIQNVSGQGTTDTGSRINNPLPDYVYRNEQSRQEMNKVIGKNENGMIADRPNGKVPVFRRPMIKPDGKPYTKEELERINATMQPSPEDFAKYQDLLRQPNTGLFRLLPDFDCETKNLVRVDAQCENFIPGSWAYSFRVKNYNGLIFSDIKLKDKDIISDGFMSQEILVSLGDTPLEKVSLQSEAVNYLTAFQPETTRAAASSQYIEIKNGIKNADFLYSNKAKAEENTTYALRVVAYSYKDKLKKRLNHQSTPDGKNFLALANDVRKDAIYAFRIVGKTADGGITILWKQLQENKSPIIVFQKDEKLSDIK